MTDQQPMTFEKLMEENEKLHGQVSSLHKLLSQVQSTPTLGLDPCPFCGEDENLYADTISTGCGNCGCSVGKQIRLPNRD